MAMTTNSLAASPVGAHALLSRQRSHVLLVFSDAKAGRSRDFLEWYRGTCWQTIQEIPNVLSLKRYERHEMDITGGRFAPVPFPYLGVCEMSLDGAQQAADIIVRIASLHQQQPAAELPATWLFYPVCEKVGRAPSTHPSMITIAFANAVRGQETEFREWYATRHIRHAMAIPALVSGQCLERTLFQRPGALEPKYQTIALYEQELPPQAILDSFASLPPGSLDFPSLEQDPSSFAESVYRPL
jgi:hypothetical protein